MTSTTSESDGGWILKQDKLGRVRTPRAQRESILDEFDRSGMSGAAFAAHVGVKYPTFAHWVQQRRRQRAKAGVGPEPTCGAAVSLNRWIEVVAEDSRPATAASVVVHLPGGAHFELRDAGQTALAAELIGRLEGGRRC